jgi:hypothetical protein
LWLTFGEKKMHEMEIKIEECWVRLDDTEAMFTIVLSVEFDNDDFIYYVEGVEHGQEDEGDLMILDKRFMSKDFICEVAECVDKPSTQAFIREKTQEEYRSILDDHNAIDYSENYEDNNYV